MVTIADGASGTGESSVSGPGGARIVVGVDGSDSSIAALKWGVGLARRLGCRVDAVISWHHPTDFSYGWVGPQLQWNPAADAEKALEEAILQAGSGEPSPVEVTPLVKEGNPALVLIEESASALMVVVGSRGRGGFAGLLLGSVSASVAERAQCPVLVVRGDGKDGTSAPDSIQGPPSWM